MAGLHNKVLKLDFPYFAGRVDTGVNATRTAEGYPIGSFFLYEMEGYLQNELGADFSYRVIISSPVTLKYVDQNQDNVIDAMTAPIQSAIPLFTTGLNSTNYRNLISPCFPGAFGQKYFSQVNFDIEGFYRGFNITERYYKEHWRRRHINTQPKASWSGKSNM